jgi:hypothetical protein
MSNHSVPYSAARLLRLCKNFLPGNDDEVEQLPDCESGEPRSVLAHRRLREYFRTWRDRHKPDHDPLCDESCDQFCIADVAIIFEEYRRLRRLEDKVLLALGPPVTRMRFNRKTRKLEHDDGRTDPDDRT